MPVPSIPADVARHLAHYVYLYVDPLDGRVFYVGKGKGARALAHLDEAASDAVRREIAAIRASGREPRIELLAHGLESAEAALTVERAAIDLVGLDVLANKVRGHGVAVGRMALEDVVAQFNNEPATITDPTILIRINRRFRYGMSAVELYDATRSAWRVGERAHDVCYAMAVYRSVIREVYEVAAWLPVGSTLTSAARARELRDEGRMEFVGRVAAEDVRERYVQRSVAHLFPTGQQNPIAYAAVAGASEPLARS